MNRTRKLSVVIAAVMVIGCMLFAAIPVNAESVSYTADLSLEKTVDGNFFIGAWDIENSAVVAVETEATTTWSESWPGHWVAGSDHAAGTTNNVTQKTEGDAEVVKFDMYPTNTFLYDSLVGFTAPANGTYAFSIQVNKNGGQSVAVRVIKNDGTVLVEAADIARNEVTTLTGEGVELAAGEQILLVVGRAEGNTAGGGFNVGFMSFEVTGETTPAPETPETPSNPETGDNVVAYVAMAVVALFGIAYVSKKH